MEKRVTKNQKRAQEQALKKQRNRLVAGIILIAAALVIAVGGVLLFLKRMPSRTLRTMSRCSRATMMP